MPGIERIHIIDDIRGTGAWRFRESAKMQPAANQLYRKMFADLNMPLADGESTIECTKQEFMAGYDASLGIDVILTFANGQTATLQEKFLFTTFDTVTVEYMQDWRAGLPGDWFKMKCQYYFVGYVNFGKFRTWILLNWPNVQMATQQGRITWGERRNQEDNARASFRYAEFDKFPRDTFLAQYEPSQDQQIELPGMERVSLNDMADWLDKRGLEVGRIEWPDGAPRPTAWTVRKA